MTQEMQVETGTSLLELSKQFQKHFITPIVLANVNNRLKELSNLIEEGNVIVFLDMTDKDGYKTYQRSVALLMIRAFNDIFGINSKQDIIIEFSINNGFYCETKPQINLTDEQLNEIQKRMDELVKKDISFEKIPIKLDQARAIFVKQNMMDKVELLKYRKASLVNICKIDEYYDYFYGHMVSNTGCLGNYQLYAHKNGFVLQLMGRLMPGKVSPFNPDQKLFDVMMRTSKWDEVMGVENVGGLNAVISSGEINELMLVSEALMEKRIAGIADQIIKDFDKKKFVFIAGPSSSGKTTFAHRLSIQLRAHGLRPHTISLDNYFVQRELTPKDESGQFDFECLEALDLTQFNIDMAELLDGKKVSMPSFNFIKGEREYHGDYLTLEHNGVLVIEGIHGLNNQLSYKIPEENKFKIYISALTALNIDNHNRIPTTDARLIRRMVRDYQYRGASAVRTISMWDSVRRGEEKHIFPFQEQADAMFNSTLVYELSVLKQYAEPLLFSVPLEAPEYIEARRLIKFLDYFLGVNSDKIPNNSLLREFVGGSCFQ